MKRVHSKIKIEYVPVAVCVIWRGWRNVMNKKVNAFVIPPLLVLIVVSVLKDSFLTKILKTVIQQLDAKQMVGLKIAIIMVLAMKMRKQV